MNYSFIRNIKGKIEDMKTISKLCLGAEKYANEYGQQKPGAEHFMLAALDLQDGSARHVFERLAVNPDAINQAIKDQHNNALASIGIVDEKIKLDVKSAAALKPSGKLYDTTPSGKTVMQKIYQNNKSRNTRLIGAHVIEVISSMEYGIAVRALQTLGVDLVTLKNAVKAECNNL